MSAVAPPGRLLRLDDARARVLEAAGPLPTETVRIEAALGRVLAGPVLSRTALPPWDNSAMDGYAIAAADVRSATDAAPVRLGVIGEIRAGAAPGGAVRPGTAVRIATGAPLPAGADAVVPVEQTTPLGVDDAPLGPRGRDAAGPLPARVDVHRAVAAGASIRRRGGDVGAGETLLEPGRPMGPAEIALAAGAGVATVTVHRRPRVGVLATGDEVRPPDGDLGPAGIPDANGPGLLALVEASGGEPMALGIAADRLDDVRAVLERAIEAGADVVVVSGGVSVGPYDVVRLAFEAVGRVELWRVAVQPGKPFAFGLADRPGGAAPSPVLLFGLPGNPVSTFVTFELFVRPVLRRLAGRQDDDLLRPVDAAVLEEPVSKSHGRRAFLRVVATRDDAGRPLRDAEGRVRVRLAGGQGSHVLSALAAADALAIVPEEPDGLPAGASVDLWWLDRS